MENKVVELYERIQNDINKQLTPRDREILSNPFLETYRSISHPIDDIVIEGDDIKLIGRDAISGLVYRWYSGKDWAVATFKPEHKVPYEDKRKLLKMLENYYGEPTRSNYHGVGDELSYDFEGKRLIIGIDTFSYITPQQEVSDRKEKKSLLSRLLRK